MTRAARKHRTTLLWVDLRGKSIDNRTAVLEFTLNRPSGQMTPARGLEELCFFGVDLLNDVCERSN